MILVLLVPSLTGCVVKTIVGAAVDTAIEVAKVPFKVGGAVIDVVSNDEDSDDEEDEATSDE
ncbi:MAG TPA: hypothetical protein ENJ32_04075 [Crenotrichaceae bacterium]|nr:hypothetical protein [Crenotrichaceae bacterium]